MNNKYLIGIIIILVLGTCYFWYENAKFPVEGVICSMGYNDCFVSARYQNMIDCESANEMGNWLCDSRTDPNNITCKPAKDSAVRSYCRD